MKKTICFPVKNRQPKFALAIRKELPFSGSYIDEPMVGKPLKQQVM